MKTSQPSHLRENRALASQQQTTQISPSPSWQQPDRLSPGDCACW